MHAATPNELRVDPELRAVIPPLDADELAQLEENIKRDGCRDPLVVWDGTIVDGHNRYDICTRNGIPYDIAPIEFESKAHAKVWMRQNQAGRRNLTPAWKIELALGNKEDLKAIGREKQRETLMRGDEPPVLSQRDKTEPNHDTRAEVAKAAGVSTGSVGMAEQVRAKAPDLWEKAKAGDIAISAAYKHVRKKQEREERRRENEARAQTLIAHQPEFRLHHEPCIKALDLDAGTVDWIITDPPYPKEYLDAYDDLARVAAHTLRPGGSLLCMTGQTYLPDVIERLARQLTYHWTLAYLTPGGQAVQQFPRHVNTFWKPVLWFVKDEYQGDWIGDVTRSNVNDNDKTRHHWGQSESGMHDLMRRFIKPNDTVLDPFMGAGTTGVAALALGAKFIGYDLDQTSYNEALVRIGDATLQR